MAAPTITPGPGRPCTASDRSHAPASWHVPASVFLEMADTSERNYGYKSGSGRSRGRACRPSSSSSTHRSRPACRTATFRPATPWPSEERPAVFKNPHREVRSPTPANPPLPRNQKVRSINTRFQDGGGSSGANATASAASASTTENVSGSNSSPTQSSFSSYRGWAGSARTSISSA
jgi:hypothetical protein